MSFEPGARTAWHTHPLGQTLHVISGAGRVQLWGGPMREIRAGDARETLRDLGGPVDFILVDGWPGAGTVSLAREVVEIVAPQLRVGGYLLNDNAEPDFLKFIRAPKNGFISMTLPIKRGTELALKVA